MRYLLAAVVTIAVLYIVSWFAMRSWGRHADRQRQARGRRRFLILALGTIGATILPKPKTAAVEQKLADPTPVQTILQTKPVASPSPAERIVAKVKPKPKASPVRTAQDKILAECRKWLGTRYSWGGGSLTGPTRGSGRGAGTTGLDCSGYTRLVYHQSLGVTLPRTAHDQMRSGRLKPTTKPRLGDLVYICSSSGIAYHCGVYAGRGVMYAAPKTGDVVRKQLIFSRSVRYRTLA